MGNSKTVGDASEARALARFVELGWAVMIPWGDNLRYDMVIDRGRGFERVQVKTARVKNGALTFRSCSQSVKASRKIKYNGQADLFAVCCPADPKIYLISVDETNHTEVFLRFEQTKNHQEKNIRWASYYAI